MSDSDVFGMHGVTSPDKIEEKLSRMCWNIAHFLFFTLLPDYGFNKIRIVILKIFGAQVGFTNQIPASVNILKPWKLVMEKNSCLSKGCDVYNFALVLLKANSIISKNTHLCTATHEYEKVGLPLTSAPITIGENVWIAADCFIGPGIVIGEGCVVGARSLVLNDLEPWMVYAGHPAKALKPRNRP